MGKPDDFVWARSRDYKLIRVRRSYAEAEGLEIDTRPGHDLSGGISQVKKLHMTPEQKRIFYHQTGVQVDDRSQCDGILKDKGLHAAEPGEQSYEMLDAMKEANDSGKPLDPRFQPENLDLFGDSDRKRSEKFNFDERRAMYEARQKAEGTYREGSWGQG